MRSGDFGLFFYQATGSQPYPYQEKLATEPVQSRLIHVPTGCGKTAAAILAWLWRRGMDPEHTPRRLVYCLPMRVLVEQTRERALDWLDAVGRLAGKVSREPGRNGQRGRVVAESYSENKVGVHVLMGGEEVEDWDLYPEREAILIGTQDMLLSRALNRGYAMSRYRWPMHFGLLNNNCLWVFDEIQLMGSGLATTAQLEAFRSSSTAASCHTWWMSATLQRSWLKTVDYADQVDGLPLTQLQAEDVNVDLEGNEDTRRTKQNLRQIHQASKPLSPATARMGDIRGLAGEVHTAHERAGGLTLVIVNTVTRAREVYAELNRLKKKASFDVVLVHSRFRPEDRTKQISRLLAEPPEHGRIVISTQVVEAGVDVSARTLFTELAPWPSLVQRFGRCNRRGLDNNNCQVFWIDLPAGEKEQEKLRHPYELEELKAAQKLLNGLNDVGLKSLDDVQHQQPFEHFWVIRRKDFIELFDTTPDLAGNDIDIDRYVRDVEESDVQVFWREWPAEQPPLDDEPRPCREELCSAPIGEFRDFVKGGCAPEHPQDVPAAPIGEFRDFVKDRDRRAYRWDYLDRKWVKVNEGSIYPGQIYLLHVKAGGYGTEQGWNVAVKEPVPAIPPEDSVPEEESNDDDRLSEGNWQSIAEHSDRVCQELDAILDKLTIREADQVKLAARWHDWGKAHEVFQSRIKKQLNDGSSRPAKWVGGNIAKAPKPWWDGRDQRNHFRHELASALGVLQQPHPLFRSLCDGELNLVAYLVAAHHGKVRLSIRSLPGETMPPDGRRFARGVWEGDVLPAVDLGGEVTAPEVKLSLEPMELGLCEQHPFVGQPSWAERILALRDRPDLGPCRLAYLEAILRAADMRASMQRDPQELKELYDA
jgi:CRISPR-associated endonuclease/helicase Cas3